DEENGVWVAGIGIGLVFLPGKDSIVIGVTQFSRGEIAGEPVRRQPAQWRAMGKDWINCDLVRAIQGKARPTSVGVVTVIYGENTEGVRRIRRVAELELNEIAESGERDAVAEALRVGTG